MGFKGYSVQVESTDNQAEAPQVPSFLPELVQAAGIRQKDISLPLRTPVLVAGDMSASMQVSPHARCCPHSDGLCLGVCYVRFHHRLNHLWPS